MNAIDEPVRPATMAERLEIERRYSPTHIVTEAGITPIETKPAKASPIQVALMDDPECLITGIEWTGLVMAGRMEIMIAIGQGPELCAEDDILAVLPEHTKLWLTGWQQQVNSGDCWRTSGSVGRTASHLIQQGYLLCAKAPTTDWIGSPIPTRGQIKPGAPGSPLWVRTVMGQRYLDWIGAID